MQNLLGVVPIHVLTHPQDIPALLYVVFHIIVRTLVCQLSHFNPIRIKSKYYFSLAKLSSKSYKSKLGGGSSFSVGGKTAACRPGIGVSN